jgi:pimeloyl-ACP methyl ester carboxylesterase
MPYFVYDGKRIFYRDEGKGDVVLLLPGNTASSASHDAEVEFFTNYFRVICPDYAGYGKIRQGGTVSSRFLVV